MAVGGPGDWRRKPKWLLCNGAEDRFASVPRNHITETRGKSGARLLHGAAHERNLMNRLMRTKADDDS